MSRHVWHQQGIEIVIEDDKVLIYKNKKLWGCTDSEEEAYRMLEEYEQI